MNKNLKKIVITSGGTGGHIFPAIALADALDSKGIKTFFITTKNFQRFIFFN